jgi:hypothetical protein
MTPALMSAGLVPSGHDWATTFHLPTRLPLHEKTAAHSEGGAECALLCQRRRALSSRHPGSPALDHAQTFALRCSTADHGCKQAPPLAISARASTPVPILPVHSKIELLEALDRQSNWVAGKTCHSQAEFCLC